MDKLRLLRDVIGKVLSSNGVTVVSDAVIPPKTDGGLTWAQNLVQLPNGQRFLIKVIPVSPEVNDESVDVQQTGTNG